MIFGNSCRHLFSFFDFQFQAYFFWPLQKYENQYAVKVKRQEKNKKPNIIKEVLGILYRASPIICLR